MKLYAAYFEGFGVQDPEPVERPLPQSKVPRMSDERYAQMVREGLAKAKARKDKEKTR